MEKEANNQTKWYETMTVKMILLGIMAIMFLIPLQLIKMVILERESNSEAVKNEISENWGKKQTLSGPVLNVPVYRIPDNSKPGPELNRKTWHILPEELIIEGSINPEIRYKGIYEAVIYESELLVKGYFDLPDEPENYKALWDEAYISMGISDNRGLKNSVTLSLDNINISAEPGLPENDLFSSGISFPVLPGKESTLLPFEIHFGLKGSEGMYFTPVGKNTSVKISSDWTSPSFSGHFLPEKREISKDGFSAHWNITHLNRNFPLQWLGPVHEIESEAFGVDMILEVDHYQKSERSSKYGLLFIAFTFMVLIFMELSSEKRIHIFSYFLVSLALVLFFSLLNSLSEQIGFNLAYILAALATVALITAFSGSIMKTRRAYFVTGGLLSGLYLFLYFLLALNEYAYLAGNIGLFIGLASVMWITSRTEIFKKNEF
ncbi:MAG: cell envelope integrity protein CreD [Marinilabiliaceae bacterium]|jgi:inner membrane protein|nr:cell envelope integrity protein CreD [Marinilabiliaceae bacterium]